MTIYDQARRHRGQSTVEYILVVAAVIVVGLVFLGKNGVFKNALNTTFNTNINSMLEMGEKILK